MVLISLVDTFESYSIYFAQVFEQRLINPPPFPVKKGYFISFFSRWFSYHRALIAELGNGISPFDFGLEQ